MLAVYRMVRDHVYAHAPGRLLLHWFSLLASAAPICDPTVTVLQAVDARQAAELHERQVQAHRHGLLQEPAACGRAGQRWLQTESPGTPRTWRAGQGFAQHCGTAAGNTQVADLTRGCLEAASACTTQLPYSQSLAPAMKLTPGQVRLTSATASMKSFGEALMPWEPRLHAKPTKAWMLR